MKKYIKNNKIKSINERTLVAPRSLANQSGAALVTALLLMLVMVTMVPVAMQLTSGEFDRTADFEGSREALAIAEAGLEHAKVLVQYNATNDILDGPDDAHSTVAGGNWSGTGSETNDNGTFTGANEPFIASTTIVSATSAIDGGTYNYTQVSSLPGGTYLIRVWDNDDSALCPTALCSASDPDPLLDTDNEAWVDRDGLVLIESIGTTDDGTSATLVAQTKRKILPTYGIQASVTLLGPVAAVKLTSATFDVTGADGAGGDGYDITGNPDAECNGVNGIALETTDGTPTSVGNAAAWSACADTICTWFTVPGAAGATGTTGSTPDLIQGATGFTAADAEALYEDINPAVNGDYRNASDSDAVQVPDSGPYTLTGGVYGSITDPVTMYFDDTLNISGGTLEGYGILIVDGDLNLTGTLDWNGIVLIGTCTTCSAACTDCPGGLTGNGNADVAGATLIGNSTVAASTSDFTGNAAFQYSCQGIGIANEAFKDTFAMVSWSRVE